MRLKNILPLLFIILTAFFWTFINYQNRWTLSQDQSRDAIIGLYAIAHHTLPLVGPPSSLGFFSFGPFYYWLIIFFSALVPNIINAPWIGFSLFSILGVVLFYFIGNSIYGKKFGFFLGLIASFSSGRVFHSVDLLNPILVPFFTTLSFLFLVRFLESKKKIYLFFLSLSIALSINFHFQALGLISILVLLFIPLFKTQIKKQFIIWMLLGLIIPFIPLLFFYSQNHLTSQSSINLHLFSIPKVFIKDLIFTWPKLFGETLFFTPNSGYPVLLFLSSAFVWIYKSKIKRPKVLQILILSFLIQILFLPFYSGERTPIYLLVFHPYILLITAWIGWQLYQKKHILGYILFALFLLITTWSNITIIKGYTQRPLISSIKQTVDNYTLGKNENKISLFQSGDSQMISLPLLYLYLKENRISNNGYRLGVCANICPKDPVPFKILENYSFYNLGASASGFKEVTIQDVYNYLYSYYTR